jgi:hypothetical protein
MHAGICLLLVNTWPEVGECLPSFDAESLVWILLVVLYGCETWSPALREKCKRWIFENRVLRKIFASKRDEVTGKRRRLHNEELYALYFRPNIIRVIKSRRLRWAGCVERMRREELHTGFWWGTWWKEPTWMTRLRWEGSNKMDFREVGRGMDWISLAQDTDRWRAVVNVVMNLRVP